MAVAIAHNLYLDVARLFNHLLDIDFARFERPLSFARCIANRSLQLALRIHPPHPLATTARRRLQQHRITNLARQLPRMLQMRGRLLAPRHHRHIQLLSQSPRRRLRPQPPNRLSRRPNKNNPRRLACRREPRILTQKPIPRMNCLSPPLPSRPQNSINVEITPNPYRLIRHPNVQCPPIDICEHRHAPNPQLPQRPHNPYRNLTPIGYQNRRKHARRLYPSPQAPFSNATTVDTMSAIEYI